MSRRQARSPLFPYTTLFRSERGELAQRRLAELAREEAHLIALGVRRDLLQGVSLDDARELRARAHDDLDVDPERVRDLRAARARELLGRAPAAEHDVAALHGRAHLLVASLLEHPAPP